MKSYGLAQRGFASQGSAFCPISADTVEQRAAPWLKSLDEWRGRKGEVKTATQVATAIATGKLKSLGLTNKASEQLLEQLPASARSNFAVEGVASRKNGATLFMVSPNVPSVIVLVQLAPGGSLLGVSVVNLAKVTGV